MSFELDIARLTNKAKGKIDLAVRKITVEVFRDVILKTPVDTGRARANWMASVGSYNQSYSMNIVDKTGSQAIAQASKIALGTPSGNITYLVNSLPYIRALEYGHSQQAPAGMVRITAMEFESKLNGVARSV